MPENRFEPTAFGGIWTGKNATGSVFLKVSSPSPFDKTVDLAEVAFIPLDDLPISQPILSQLLSKAESIKLNGGDSVDLEFPAERAAVSAHPCMSHTTLTVRLSGSLVLNSRKIICEVPKR